MRKTYICELRYINFLQISIIFLCSIILFIRVMYCKHETQADRESKRRILSEKIEMKRNSANLKRLSIMPNATARVVDMIHKSSIGEGANDQLKLEKQTLDLITEEDGPKPTRPHHLNALKDKPGATERR